MAIKLRAVNISNEIRDHPAYSTAVEHTLALLEDHAPPSGVHVVADWNVVQESGHSPTLSLKISDTWEASASAEFPLDEMNDKESLERQLNWLWDDLLQDRSHKQFSEIERHFKEVGEGATQGAGENQF